MSVRSTPATGNGPASAARAGGPAGPGHDDAKVAERVDELIAEMTPAEKAGQLTQYFYFGACRGERRRTGPCVDVGGQPADGRGGAGARGGRARCCSSPIRPRSTGCSGSRSRATGSASRCCSASTSSTGCAPSSRCRSRWPRPGTRRPSSAGQAVAAREARAVGIHWTFAPMVDIARDPRWGRIIEGAGEDPYLGAAVAAAQVRGFQGDGAGRARARHRRAQALRRLRRRARRPRLRRGQPLRLRAVERLPPAVRGRGRGRRRQRDDRLHGPQRHPGHRQPLAVHRGAARDAGASRASWSATPTPCATC